MKVKPYERAPHRTVSAQPGASWRWAARPLTQGFIALDTLKELATSIRSSERHGVARCVMVCQKLTKAVDTLKPSAPAAVAVLHASGLDAAMITEGSAHGGSGCTVSVLRDVAQSNVCRSGYGV